MKNFLLGVMTCISIAALCGANVQNAAPKYMAKTIIRRGILFETTIDELGSEGWELIDFEPVGLDQNGQAVISMVFKKE